MVALYTRRRKHTRRGKKRVSAVRAHRLKLSKVQLRTFGPRGSALPFVQRRALLDADLAAQRADARAAADRARVAREQARLLKDQRKAKRSEEKAIRKETEERRVAEDISERVGSRVSGSAYPSRAEKEGRFGLVKERVLRQPTLAEQLRAGILPSEDEAAARLDERQKRWRAEDEAEVDRLRLRLTKVKQAQAAQQAADAEAARLRRGAN
jgi:hypothetical protein